MTTLLTDDFTGSNGAALDTGKWTTGYVGTGASTAIQGNRGRWLTGTAGGYAGGARISRRAVITSPADVEVTGTYTPNGESYPEIYVRASDTVFDTNQGYAIRFPTQGGNTNLRIYKYVSYTGTQLGSSNFTASNGTTYGFRFQVIGSAIKGKIWTGSESGWNIEVTDTAITAAGNVGLSVGAGNAASTYVDFDDLVITDGASSGSLTIADTAAFSDTFVASVTQTAVADTAAFTDAITIQSVTPTTLPADTLTCTDALSVAVYQSRHDVKTEIEFTAGVWTDVSAWLPAEVECTGTFGRPTRYEDVGASAWDVTLRNSDGRFTPGNPSSPYFPNVAKGKRLRVSVAYSGQSYPRFWGFITSITMPALTSVEGAVVRVHAADLMATLNRKVLLSPFVEESRRQARIATGGGVDVFPFPPLSVKTDGSVQVSDSSFENKGLLFPGSARLGSVSVMAAGNAAGIARSSSADTDGGILSEGQLDFESADNGEGKQAHPIIVARPQVGFEQFELLFKLPAGALPALIWPAGGPTHTIVSGNNWNTVPALYGMTQAELAELNPEQFPTAMGIGNVLKVVNSTIRADSEWILAHLWAGSTEVLRIVLGNLDGKCVLAAKKPDGTAQYIYSAASIADNKWRKLTIYKDGADSIRANLNDSPSGSSSTGLPADLTAVDTVYVGGRHSPIAAAGRQVQCPPCSVGGVAFQHTRTGVWYWHVLGAPPANVTAAERFLELVQYADPISFASGLAWHTSLSVPFEAKVVRTPTAGRTVLDCLQELARTVGAYLWVQPSDGVLTMRKGPVPPLDVVTIDLIGDADELSPPQWTDAVDTQPTRVTARCPAGEVTSVNTAAESAGMFRELTVATCAPTVAVAKGVADRHLAGASTLRLTNLQVDLVHSAAPLWGSFLPTFLPGERLLHVTSCPEPVIGYATVDAVVESWVESYTIGSARFAFTTTPVADTVIIPPVAGFTVTSTTGSQSGAAVTAAQPAGTTAGDLLLAVMTVDDTGALAAMTPPDVTWIERGAGGSSAAGHGRVWTRTAGPTEPASYLFTTGGAQILVTDPFPPSAGGGGVTWPLSVSTNGHYLKDAAGAAFFYCADTAWVTLSRLSLADAKQYMDIKAGQGFRAMQSSLTLWNRNNAGARGAPFVGGNMTQPNTSYWTGIDELLDYAQNLGMLVVLWPMWLADNGGWAGGSAPSQSEFTTYCTWLGNRYAGQPNIAWALGGDEQHSEFASLMNAGGAALNAADPNHPITYHPRWDSYEMRTQSWLDFNSIQRNDNNSPYTYQLARTGYELTGPTQPFLNSEPPYYPGTAGGNSTSPKRNRMNGWWTVLAGALGVVYGDSRYGTWDIGADGQYDWASTAHVTGTHTGNIRKVLEQFHWERLVPDWGSGVVTSGRGSYGGLDYKTVGRGTDGSLIVVYAPDGGAVTVALSQLSAAGVAYWFDPSTGNVAGNPQTVSNSGSSSFSPPAGSNASGDTDWVLLLTTEAGRAGSGSTAFDSTKWAAGQTTTGATRTVSADGWGLLNTGTLTGGTGHCAAKANIPVKADIDLTCTFRLSVADMSLSAVLRGDTGGNTTDGYELRVVPGSGGSPLRLITGGTVTTTIATVAGTITAGTAYRLRCQAIGSTIQARIWPAASVEPSAWGASGTNAGHPAAGTVYVAAHGGAAAGAIAYLDDVTVTDTAAVGTVPEAKLSLLRVAGAHPTAPLLVNPVWSSAGSATLTHAAPSLAPASPGLLVNHWHILTEGAGSGGGGGGGTEAFSFGMSGFETAAQIDAGNAWLANHSLKAIGLWADTTAQVQMDAWGIGPGETYGGWSGVVDFAIGGIFGSETWAQAAAGNFDSRWTTSLNTIGTKWGSRPPGNLHLRFAHEFNGDFSPWYVQPGEATDFRNAWIRWANLVRSILPGVQIAWSPNDEFSGGAATIENVWPGNTYVDVVAPDSYNWWPHSTTLAEFQAHMLLQDGNGNPKGLERWRVWAEGKGKPLALGEWGNPAADGGGGGGGDHPVYVEQMLAWFGQHGGFGPGKIKYGIYFNHGLADGYDYDFLIWASGTNGSVNQPLTAAYVRDNY